MKKNIPAALIFGTIALAFASCSDDSFSKIANGKSCKSDTECVSKYCSPENVCAEKPANQENTNQNTNNENDCGQDEDCENGSGSSSGTPSNPGNQESEETISCTESSECPDDSVCYESACLSLDKLGGKPCTTESAQCMKGRLVECRQWAGMDTFYNVIKCKDGEVCSEFNAEVVSCARPCEASEVHNTYTECDPDNTDDEGWSIGEIIFECTEYANGYYYVAKDWRQCDFGEACIMSDHCE